MNMGKQCTNPDCELQIIREIVGTVLQGKELELSPESRKHLDGCEKCRECTPLYVANSKAAFANKKYEALIEEAEHGDRGILKKTVKQGLALFKPGPEGKPGVLVIVDPEHHAAQRVQDDTLTLKEFEAL
jgi:hypothetical protein